MNMNMMMMMMMMMMMIIEETLEEKRWREPTAFCLSKQYHCVPSRAVRPVVCGRKF